MKKFATIGAAVTMTALASMGANATTYNFDVVQTSSTSGAASGTGTLNGTGTWDDSTGAVVITSAGTNNITVGPTTYALTITAEADFSGNTGSPFAPTSGQNALTSCSDTVGGFLCNQSGVGTFTAFSSVGGSFDATGGTLTSVSINGSGSQSATTDTTYNISNVNVSAVPLPAAAWLFGSGLVGLAGVARRRRS